MTKRFLLLVVLLATTGCDQKDAFEKALPFDDVNFAKSYMARLLALDFPAVEEKVDQRFKDAQLREKLEKIAAQFPSTQPTDIQAVGAQTFKSTNANGTTTRTTVTLQYQFPQKWLLATVATEKHGAERTVTSVNVQPLSDSLANINRFTFFGKGFMQYFILALAIGCMLVIILALILVFRTPIPKRKWLWVVFILLGVAQFTVNWTNGSLNINPLRIQFLSAASWWPGPFAPVFVSASIPLGAIVFLFRRRKWLAPSSPNEG